MDRDHSRASGGTGFIWAGHPSPARVLDRQRDELRRERDRMMLDLAASLGPDEFAQHLGVSAASMARLLDEARGRIGGSAAGPDGAGPEISVRRLGDGTDRWAAADAHYAKLGRASD
jgi:hypothetical protein